MNVPNCLAAAIHTLLTADDAKNPKFPRTGCRSKKRLEGLVGDIADKNCYEAEANYFLGWIQCACVAANALTPKQLEEILERWEHDGDEE